MVTMRVNVAQVPSCTCPRVLLARMARHSELHPALPDPNTYMNIRNDGYLERRYSATRWQCYQRYALSLVGEVSR